MPEKWILRQYQSLPLRAKIGMTENRIIEWYEHFNGAVCVSFSGGKDSTVLAHLVHEYYPDVPLVFSNTGLEYPEIQAFARKMGAIFVRPKMSFSEVISRYGYPIISKENAEAIYYARRIRNSYGGVLRQPTNAVKSTVPEHAGGGTLTSDRRRNPDKYPQPRNWRRENLTNYAGGWYKRSELLWSNLPYAEWKQQKVLQTGMTGDETPSPG